MWKPRFGGAFTFRCHFLGSDQAIIGIRAKIATRPRGSFFDLLGKC